MGTVDGALVPLPAQGISLYCRDWGGDGPPIVLLHGLSSNSRIWDWTAPLLAERFHVIAVDQRGHGLSTKPEAAYRFTDVTGDLAALAENLSLERPVIVGHSWGGSVAVEFAAMYPERSRGIVLVDGGFTSPGAHMTWEQAETVMRPPAIDGVPVEAFVNSARSWPQLKDSWSDGLQEMLLSNFEVRDGKIYRWLPVEKHMMIVRELFDQRLDEVFPRVRCPALLIPAIRSPTNEAERTWQEWRKEGIAAAMTMLPDARLLAMEDTVHDVPVQRPKELAAAIAEFAAQLA